MNSSTLEIYNYLDIHASHEEIKAKIDLPLENHIQKLISNEMLYLSNERIVRIDQNSENAFIFIWDSMIRHPMELIFEYFNLDYKIARNITESSHLDKDENATLRPDFMIFIERNSANAQQSDKKLLVFKGEEKASSNKLSEAKIELVKKISNKNINGSSVYFPLLFCYAAAGKNVQFFVIDRTINDEKNGKKKRNNENEITEMSDILDLTDSNQRTKIINIVTNIALIIVEWSKNDIFS